MRKLNKEKYIRAIENFAVESGKNVFVEFCDHAEFVEILYHEELVVTIDYSTLCYCYRRTTAFVKEIENAVYLFEQSKLEYYDAWWDDGDEVYMNCIEGHRW